MLQRKNESYEEFRERVNAYNRARRKSDPSVRLKEIEWEKKNWERISARRKAWRENNKEKIDDWRDRNAEKTEAYALKSRCNRYGITVDDFCAAITLQCYRCILCGRSIEVGKNNGNTAVIDHDHTSGEARGIICTSCNMVIGHIEKRGWNFKEFAKNVDNYLNPVPASKDALDMVKKIFSNTDA